MAWWLWLVGGAALGAVATAVLVALSKQLKSRRMVEPAETPANGGGEPATQSTEEPPRELLAAWIEFLKDDLARAVNALNNRLNVIAQLGDSFTGPGFTKQQNERATQIRREVRRAAKITRGLLRRVSAIAPDTLPDKVVRVQGSAATKSAHLLVVEDDAANRSVISKLFTKLGHRVTAVSDGFEAYALLQRNPVDCIICDLRMPSVSGRTLFEQIEELMPQLARRFVFVTGDFTRPSSREFLDRSGAPVVAKPYAVEELLAAVDAVLARTSVARSR